MLISDIERNDKFWKFSKSSLQAPGSASLSVPVHQKDEGSFKKALGKRERGVILSVGNRRRFSRRAPLASQVEIKIQRRLGERRKPDQSLEEKEIVVVAFDKNENTGATFKPGDSVYFNSGAIKEETSAPDKPVSSVHQNTASPTIQNNQPDYIVELSGKSPKRS